MTPRNLSKCFLPLALLVFAFHLYAQNPTKAIVLINGQPFVVELMSDGTILKKYQGVPKYFSMAATDEAIIDQLSKQGLIEDSDFSVFRDTDSVPEFGEGPAEIDGIDVLRDQQFISFSLQRAILNRDAVDQVRTIANAYQEGRFSRVFINAYHTDTERSRRLATNRANAIADLMETFGVKPSAINVNLPVTLNESSLSFVNVGFE